MKLSNNNANKEVPSDLEASTSRRFEESHLSSETTSTAAISASSSIGAKRLQQKKQVEEECEGNLPRRPSPKKLRKRRPNSTERERSPRMKGTGKTASDVDFKNMGETGEDGSDSLASGGTFVDSSSAEDSESDLETTRKKVGFGTRKTRPERQERLKGPTPSDSSTVFPHKQNGPKEKRFECSLCPKRFLYASHLRRHESNHTNEKFHKCPCCKRSFRRVSNLRRHELIHSNERPHACSSCDMSFRQLAHLRRHELCYKGKKPHKCAFCPKKFCAKGSAWCHEEVHRTSQ